MTNIEFKYWIRGYFQLDGENKPFNWHQIRMLKNHLNLVKAIEEQISPENQWLENELNLMINENRTSDAALEKITLEVRERYL